MLNPRTRFQVELMETIFQRTCGQRIVPNSSGVLFFRLWGKMLVFNNDFTYNMPFHIVFLCGSEFHAKNTRDKRIVLKLYIENNFFNYYSVILENHFSFGVTTKRYLAYDDIYLSNLAQVEQLASLFADKIIIIHETISTAAEVGMFAADKDLTNKICLLVADAASVEENKTGNFIRLAFLNKSSEETNVKLITYYPDTEVFRFSENKSDYHTFFHEDQIGKYLGEKIKQFLTIDSEEHTLHLKKAIYGLDTLTSNNFTYALRNNKIIVNIPPKALQIQLLSLLYLNEIRKELRKEKHIRDHITYLYNQYRTTLHNTIKDFSETNVDSYSLDIVLGNSLCDAKQAIGYFMYMLQAIGLIRLEQQSNRDLLIRKVVLTVEFDNYKHFFINCVYELGETEFGSLIK